MFEGDLYFDFLPQINYHHQRWFEFIAPGRCQASFFKASNSQETSRKCARHRTPRNKKLLRPVGAFWVQSCRFLNIRRNSRTNYPFLATAWPIDRSRRFWLSPPGEILRHKFDSRLQISPGRFPVLRHSSLPATAF